MEYFGIPNIQARQHQFMMSHMGLISSIQARQEWENRPPRRNDGDCCRGALAAEIGRRHPREKQKN